MLLTVQKLYHTLAFLYYIHQDIRVDAPDRVNSIVLLEKLCILP